MPDDGDDARAVLTNDCATRSRARFAQSSANWIDRWRLLAHAGLALISSGELNALLLAGPYAWLRHGPAPNVTVAPNRASTRPGRR